MKYVEWNTRDYVKPVWGIKINNQYIIFNENLDKIIRWSILWDGSESGYWEREEMSEDEASNKMHVLIKGVF